jgi:hypothetical protein
MVEPGFPEFNHLSDKLSFRASTKRVILAFTGEKTPDES